MSKNTSPRETITAIALVLIFSVGVGGINRVVKQNQASAYVLPTPLPKVSPSSTPSPTPVAP